MTRFDHRLVKIWSACFVFGNIMCCCWFYCLVASLGQTLGLLRMVRQNLWRETMMSTSDGELKFGWRLSKLLPHWLFWEYYIFTYQVSHKPSVFLYCISTCNYIPWSLALLWAIFWSNVVLMHIYCRLSVRLCTEMILYETWNLISGTEISSPCGSYCSLHYLTLRCMYYMGFWLFYKPLVAKRSALMKAKSPYWRIWQSALDVNTEYLYEIFKNFFSPRHIYGWRI